MKNFVRSLVICTAVLCVSTPAVAQKSKSVKEIDKSFEVIDGEVVEVSSQVISIPEESEGGISLYAAGERRGSINNYKPLFSNWYSVASSSADYAQDQITARARLYNINGVLWASDSQTLKKAKSVTASAKSKANQTNFNGAYSLGDHTFKRSGYKDTFLETRNNW